MGHGGSRARSGSAPDPNALRRDRPDDQATWTTLPASRVGPVPVWPLPTTPTVAELAEWRDLWSTPPATVWEWRGLHKEVALYVRTYLEAQQPNSALGLRKEERMRAENLGLTHTGQLKFRWRIDATPDTSTAATASKSPAARPARGTSRDRFRVVPPVDDGPSED